MLAECLSLCTLRSGLGNTLSRAAVCSLEIAQRHPRGYVLKSPDKRLAVCVHRPTLVRQSHCRATMSYVPVVEVKKYEEQLDRKVAKVKDLFKDFDLPEMEVCR
jgi:hypothetical protein